MSMVSPLNGSASTLRHAAVDRRPDESLHDFLLRRHDEMADELVMLHAQIAWQDERLRVEQLATHRGRAWLIAGLALDATFAMLLCLAGLFNALPISMAAVTLAVLLVGNLLAIGMPRLERALVGLGAWRRR